MADVANYIAQNSPRFNRAAVDRSQYQNALMQNQVARIPQANKAQDLAIQGDEQALNQNRQGAARKFVSEGFSALAQSQDPIKFGQTMLANPSFQAAMKDAGLDPSQFTIDPAKGDTAETISRSAMDHARMLGAQTLDQQRRVQSTQVLEDGTIALVGSDGTITRTKEKARNDQRFVQVGGGTGAFDPRTGNINPITSATQENTAAADKAGAEAWSRAAATAGVDLQKEQVGRQGTLGVWRVARKGLLDGLAGTDTGPVAGRMPAFTVGQQVAEGAVAAVAPVLKALFRSAGEGTFSDRDQQLLVDMIPNRNDHPQTIVSKMQMIDAIIEAKLAAPASMPTTAPGRMQPAAVPQAAPAGNSYGGSADDPLGLF